MSEPVASASAIIRHPPFEVFDAFVRPEKLTQFWLTRASDPEKDAKVEWHFVCPAHRRRCGHGIRAAAPSTFDWPGMHFEMRFDDYDQHRARRRDARSRCT